MSYPIDAATAALVAGIPGLHADVARAWATAEQGVSNNILGVTYTGPDGRQRLRAYPTLLAGAQGAYWLLTHDPYPGAYAGVRAALAGGSSAQQAAAVIASPWNHPYYSAGAGAAALRAIAAAGRPGSGMGPHVRVTAGPFTTWTRRTGGHSLRQAPVDTVYAVDPAQVWPFRGMRLVPLTSGPYAGLWVNPHGPLAYSAS